MKPEDVAGWIVGFLRPAGVQEWVLEAVRNRILFGCNKVIVQEREACAKAAREWNPPPGWWADEGGTSLDVCNVQEIRESFSVAILTRKD